MTSTKKFSNIPDSFALIDIPHTADVRGTLCVADPADGRFPFDVKRAFWIYGVPEKEMRGSHAHHTCAEVLVPVCGSFVAHVDDGRQAADFVMNSPETGIYIPAKVWCSFTDFSADCVCLCLASHPYEREGYINDYDEFLKAVKQ